MVYYLTKYENGWVIDYDTDKTTLIESIDDLPDFMRLVQQEKTEG